MLEGSDCVKARGRRAEGQSPDQTRSVSRISYILGLILKAMEGSVKGLRQEKGVVRFPRHRDHLGPFWEGGLETRAHGKGLTGRPCNGPGESRWVPSPGGGMEAVDRFQTGTVGMARK